MCFCRIQQKMKWSKVDLFKNLSTFIAARCNRVSPLWFLFITAGLAELGRPTVAPRVQGDFLQVARTEGLSPCSSLEPLVFLSQLGLVTDARTAGDNNILDFLLRPGEVLGLFGVVSKVLTFSSTLDVFVEGLVGETLTCFSGSSVGLRSFTDGVFFWMTLTNILWLGETLLFVSMVLPPERLSFMLFLTALSSLLFPCGTSGWGLSEVTAGLRKETLLLDRFAPSAQAWSFCIDISTSSMIPHCWFIASSLFFFMFCLVCLRVVVVAPCTNFFLLAAFFLADLFFLFLVSSLRLWGEEEPESWEDEVKLKTDRSCCWVVKVSGGDAAFSPKDSLSARVRSEGFSTMQRTLRLRGLNQILKFFFCLKTGLSGCVWISVTEKSAIETINTGSTKQHFNSGT